jgi:2-dehydro-3-deoxyphosphogluconate aldolase/(4S)-4-hydroxy-2-oxoglutarate aldolase
VKPTDAASSCRTAESLRLGAVIAVVTIERESDAIPVVEALMGGGIGAIELTLRTPAALAALKRMRAAAPKLQLGAGTVLTPAQADLAQDAGADFALAPGFDAATVTHCARLGLPFIPGVATASEVQQAINLGCRVLKFFPAEALGGARGLRLLNAPFEHLGLRFVPLGGIDAGLAPGYLAQRCVAAVGGSWIASAERIRRAAWSEIREQAAAASALTRPAANVS